MCCSNKHTHTKPDDGSLEEAVHVGTTDIQSVRRHLFTMRKRKHLKENMLKICTVALSHTEVILTLCTAVISPLLVNLLSSALCLEFLPWVFYV